MKSQIRLSEKDFSQQVVDYAQLKGWKVARWPTWRPTGTYPGVPDIICAKEGRVVFLELKSSRGKLTEAQKEWVSAIIGIWWHPDHPIWNRFQWDKGFRWDKGMVAAAVVRPQDWDIVEELLGGNKLQALIRRLEGNPE